MFLLCFARGPSAADPLSIYIHLIVALCVTDFKPSSCYHLFSRSSGANTAKMFLLPWRGHGGVADGFCSALGQEVVVCLQRMSAGTRRSGKKQSCSVGVSRTSVQEAASCVPLLLLPGAGRACARGSLECFWLLPHCRWHLAA